MLLLSLPAPLSLLLLRLLGPRLLRPLLGFLGAVAVGTLCGDALLHLLPHVGAAPPRPLPQGPPPSQDILSPTPAAARSCLLVGSVGEGHPGRGVLSGAGGLLEPAVDRLSVRPKEGSTLQPVGGRRRTWAPGCQCSAVSSCSSSWRTCWGSCGVEGASQ